LIHKLLHQLFHQPAILSQSAIHDTIPPTLTPITFPPHQSLPTRTPVQKQLIMSALFNFNALLLVILLLICTCTYVRQVVPGMVDSRKDKNIFFGVFWKFARIGERLSPYVSICCIIMAVVSFVG
ncbi:DUF1242-domain-containing protein, partial [Ascodesmis nigricans]